LYVEDSDSLNEMFKECEVEGVDAMEAIVERNVGG
jgi:hypothetical protein